jgi:hypothetical protein
LIALDPAGLVLEIEAAKKLRAEHLKNTVELVRRYVGNYYRTRQRGKPVPENMIFSYIAGTLPKIIFDNPEVSVSAKQVITAKPVARAMREALNAWIKEVDLRQELEAVALDMLLGFGVMMHGIEARGDFAADPEWGVQERMHLQALVPFLIRVEPSSFFMDSQAKSFHQCRILGREFQRDLEDMQQDPRYDQDTVGRLTAEGSEDPRNRGQQNFPNTRDGHLRKRVTLYEVYLPEHRKIATIAMNSAGEGLWVRPPSPYRGPNDGPYVLFGVYGVPDCPYPLSPIAAMAEQFMELNAHASAAASEAATHKKLVIVNSNNPTMKAEVHAAPSGSVVAIPNFSAQDLANVELGGTSETRLKYLMLLKDRCDRVIGASDAQRGKAAGVTATEAQIADANGDAREDFINLKYRDGVKRSLRGVGWYMFYDPSVVMPVSVEDPQSGQQSEGVFLGGMQPGQEEMSWPDFFLEIEPHSMKRVDPAVQQQQATAMIGIAVQIAPMIVQFPFINWRSILDDLGEANNIPDYANRILNQQGLAMIQAGTAFGMLPGMPQQGVENGMPPAQPPGMNPGLMQPGGMFPRAGASQGMPPGLPGPGMQGGGLVGAQQLQTDRPMAAGL